MKLSSGDNALLFFAVGLIILSILNFRQGHNTSAVCWLMGAFGCAVMLCAGHIGGRSQKG